MLTAGNGARSSLANGITRMICSAADGATIDIKSYFVIPSSGLFMRRLHDDLYLMRRYHHVRVNIFVGRNFYSKRGWSRFRQTFAFAHIGWCQRSCHTNEAATCTHSKWITVSRLAARVGGGPAVLSTSANLSTQQFGAGQSGILTIRNQPLFRAFVSEWSNYQRCYLYHQCALGHRVARWQGSKDVQVYFAPVVDNPIIKILDALPCTSGSTVSLMSMGVVHTTFIKALETLTGKGCRLRTLLSPHHAVGVRALAGSTRCVPEQHDKAVIIDADGQHIVIAGSLDFNTHAEHRNDNQMIRTGVRSVWNAYQSYFNRDWHRSVSCP
jgi:hypothetical protein